MRHHPPGLPRFPHRRAWNRLRNRSTLSAERRFGRPSSPRARNPAGAASRVRVWFSGTAGLTRLEQASAPPFASDQRRAIANQAPEPGLRVASARRQSRCRALQCFAPGDPNTASESKEVSYKAGRSGDRWRDREELVQRLLRRTRCLCKVRAAVAQRGRKWGDGVLVRRR